MPFSAFIFCQHSYSVPYPQCSLKCQTHTHWHTHIKFYALVHICTSAGLCALPTMLIQVSDTPTHTHPHTHTYNYAFVHMCTSAGLCALSCVCVCVCVLLEASVPNPQCSYECQTIICTRTYVHLCRPLCPTHDAHTSVTHTHRHTHNHTRIIICTHAYVHLCRPLCPILCLCVCVRVCVCVLLEASVPCPQCS
jgi:hypothetical protein